MTARTDREKASTAEGRRLAAQHEGARATVEDKIDAANATLRKAGADAARAMGKKLGRK